MSITGPMHDEKAIAALDSLFGPGFSRPQAEYWINNLCKELDLENQSILDFGSGLGGTACYLAENYDSQIIGVEFAELLVAQSQALAEEYHVTQRVSFEQVDDMPLPFNDKHFDIILAMDALSDYKDKNSLFAELKRVLKPHGTFTLADWFHKSDHCSSDTRAFFDFAEQPFYLCSAQTILQNLEKQKFNYVNFKDTTKSMLEAVEKTLKILQSEKRENFVTQFGWEYYEWWLEYWSLLFAACQSGDLITGHVRGVKV